MMWSFVWTTMTSPHSEERPVLHCLSLRNNGEHQGLMAQIITDDNAAVAPLLSDSKELSSNEM
jgi:hypothetical protein